MQEVRFMKRCPAHLALLLVLTGHLTGCLTGCSAVPEPAYDPGAFSCTLAIDSVSTGESGHFAAEYVRQDQQATLTLTSPERLNGIVFTFSGEDCTLSAGACAIPLSRAVSESLGILTGLLSLPPEEALSRQKTADGTVLFHHGGQVTLNADGMPVLIRTDTGRQAAVTMHTP